LANNNFGDELCSNLVDALLKANAPITILNLSHNTISDKGATHLAELVNAHYHLKVLKISWNKIKTRGGIAIAEALKDNTKI
jgi:Ran GTPase-activating protein (RanGAP) involved in mRNA processing and transport